jgi:3-isopropylmalate dehydratase small subunit
MTKSVICGRAYPLGLDNVDTDLIIAAEHLKMLSRVGLGKHAFGALRKVKGNLFEDRRYRGASILVAGQNFGCGSSREHAVWALKDLGIEAIIAGSFSDIFAGNAFKNRLAAVAIGPARLPEVLRHAETGVLSVNLQSKMVSLGDRSLPFVMDEGQRAMLLAGGNEIGMTLEFEVEIAAHENNAAAALAPVPLVGGCPA